MLFWQKQEANNHENLPIPRSIRSTTMTNLTDEELLKALHSAAGRLSYLNAGERTNYKHSAQQQARKEFYELFNLCKERELYCNLQGYLI